MASPALGLPGVLYMLTIGSNKVDLQLLEEMGIRPDVPVREKKLSLKTVGLAVLASVRMQRMRAEWAEKERVHESLIKKLEAMRRKKSVAR